MVNRKPFRRLFEGRLRPASDYEHQGLDAIDREFESDWNRLSPAEQDAIRDSALSPNPLKEMRSPEGYIGPSGVTEIRDQVARKRGAVEKKLAEYKTKLKNSRDAEERREYHARIAAIEASLEPYTSAMKWLERQAADLRQAQKHALNAEVRDGVYVYQMAEEKARKLAREMEQLPPDQWDEATQEHFRERQTALAKEFHEIKSEITRASKYGNELASSTHGGLNYPWGKLTSAEKNARGAVQTVNKIRSERTEAGKKIHRQQKEDRERLDKAAKAQKESEEEARKRREAIIRFKNETGKRRTIARASERARRTGVGTYYDRDDLAKYERRSKEILANPDKFTATEVAEAKAFRHNESRAKASFHRRNELEQKKENLEGTIDRLKEMRKSSKLDAGERDAIDRRLVVNKTRLQEVDEMIAKGNYYGESKFEARTGSVASVAEALFKRPFFGAKVRARSAAQSAKDFRRESTERVNKVRNTAAVRAVSESVEEGVTAKFFGTIWGRQAKHYRYQERKAVEAQRIAKSNLWEWYYALSNPVRFTVTMALFLAPLMVPVGIIQMAGWGAFVVAAFVINALAQFAMEIVNIVVFVILSGVNIVGSTIATGADFLAFTLLSGTLCPGWTVPGAPPASCGYHSLNFHFGVHTVQSAPLLDPRLFFPTIFNNNSLFSTLMTFAQGIPSWFIIIGAILAILALPIIGMGESDSWKRWTVGILIAATAIPAFATQVAFVNDSTFTCGTDAHSCGMYEWLADEFRTGVKNVFALPAQKFAQAALDAVLNAQAALPHFSGGSDGGA